MALLLVVSLIWAFSFGLIKGRLAGIDPALVSLVRVVLGLALFAPLFRPRGLGLLSALLLAVVGAVQFGLMYVLYTAAFRDLKAYEVAALTIFTPVFVCWLEDLADRSPRAWPWAAAALAVVGAGVVVVDKPFGQVPWRGVALVQGSNVCFALGQVVYRRWRRRRPEVEEPRVFALLFAGAAVATLPAAVPALPTLAGLSRSQWLVLVYLGVVASGLGFFLWNRGAARTSGALLAVANNVKIPLGLACSLWVFGEDGEPWRLALGSVFIVLAGLLADWSSRRAAGA